MISASHMWSSGAPHALVIGVGADEGLGYYIVSSTDSGVQFTELCYSFIWSRGYRSNEDNGKNQNYYLYTENWYRSMSPILFGEDYIARIVRMVGELGIYGIQQNGGVQFTELCYEKYSEVGFTILKEMILIFLLI